MDNGQLADKSKTMKSDAIRVITDDMEYPLTVMTRFKKYKIVMNKETNLPDIIKIRQCPEVDETILIKLCSHHDWKQTRIIDVYRDEQYGKVFEVSVMPFEELPVNEWHYTGFCVDFENKMKFYREVYSVIDDKKLSSKVKKELLKKIEVN